MQELDYIKSKLKKKYMLEDAVKTLIFDQSTVCPSKGMSEKNEAIAYLTKEAFDVIHDDKFYEYVIDLYKNKDSLDEWDKALIRQLYRKYLIEKNISTDDTYEFSLNESNAFVSWSDAKEKADYSLFKDDLKKIVDQSILKAKRREADPVGNSVPNDTYDRLLDIFEEGMLQKDIDPLFDEYKERVINLIDKILSSKKVIRTDFISRPVSIEKQREITKYLMDIQGFDFDRGIFSTSEHGYTERLSANDVRITTHFYEDQFLSSIYTVLHETGHALFDQRQPQKNTEYYIFDGKTLGMHESVSRFYENIIGRSYGFIKMIYPGLKEIIPDVLSDVTDRELFEAASRVNLSLIRTEADEVTYGLHVIIRYELEKELISGRLSPDDLPKAWNNKYEEYLRICPSNDREGVLQDVHWTSDFGYFPTYLLGNFYNSMYYNRLKEEVDLEKVYSGGTLEPVNKWMTENVFAKADRLTPKEWIRDITGRAVCADDFMTYLEEKYSVIYEL